MPDDKPASPIWTDDGPSSLVKTTDTPSTPEKAAEDKEDEAIITGIGHTSPSHPVVLAKHSAKEEFLGADKGRWKLDLESYARFNAHEIHTGYLNRLHTGRDFEAGPG